MREIKNLSEINEDEIKKIKKVGIVEFFCTPKYAWTS